jgi:Xaa-Pro aminopeptidase
VNETGRNRLNRLRGGFALLTLLTLCLAQRAAPTAPPLARENAASGRLFGQTLDEFANRRELVREAAKGGIVLLRAPAEGGDVDRVRFRTDNNVMYLTGVEAPRACLALLPEGDPSGKREILFLPPQNAGASVWTAPYPGPGAETERATGIESVQSTRTMWETLRPSLMNAKTVHLAGPVGERARYTETAELEARLRAINPNLEITGSAQSLIHPLRWRKSPGEIANLRAAIAATADAQISVARFLRKDVTELAAEGVIIAAFRRGGAVREGFPCIVGSGPNSNILHYFAGDRKMQPGDLVVVDIGAEYNYYTADITRTFPVSGRFTPRQREVYQLVLDTQRACEKYVVPGKTTLWELDQYARDFMRKSPLRAKDSKGELRTMDAFFVHGLGHWLGMDVHDVSGGSAVLQPGVVFTIEPGIYLPSEGFGIRIEDDYLVTPGGLEKLSRDLPSDPAQIEAIMRGSRR